MADMKHFHAVLPLLALAACSAGTPPADESHDAAPAFTPGVYQILTIDGEPVVNPAAGTSEWQKAQFGFGERSYGGDAGCNGLGGLYLRVGNRLYTQPGPQTAMGCSGRPAEQEDAVNAIFASSPQVSSGGTEVRLEGGGHRMTLERIAAEIPQDPPTAWQGSQLADQDFIIETIGSKRLPGDLIWSDNPPKLSFGRQKISLRINCPDFVSARFEESEGAISVENFTAPCPGGQFERALAAILEADAKFVTGPNGELLIASSAGWASGNNVRRERPK